MVDEETRIASLVEALRIIVEDNPGIYVKEALVKTVRQEQTTLSEVRYALTYARRYNIVTVDSHTLKITIPTANTNN